MANEDKNTILGWPKRIVQSITYGAIEAVKEKMPVMFSTVENNKEAVKQLYQETLGSRQQLKKLQTIQDTYVFKPAKELLKNLKSDIKSGVFYHPERAAQAEENATKAMMEDLLKEAGMEDMMGMLTGDEEIPEGELQDMPITPVAEVRSGDAFVAATVAQEQRYAVNSLAKIQSDIADAQMHAFRTVGNMQLKGMQKQTNLIHQGFGAVIQGFNNLNDFHENVLFKHVENSTKYYETMTQLTQENNAIFKEMVEMKRNQYKAATKPEEEDPNKVPTKSALFKNGIFDLGSYIKIVQSNANDAFMMLNMTLAAVQGIIAGVVANPMQFATKQVVSALMGPQLRSALKKFDSSITGYIATGLAKLGDWGNDPKSGMLGMLGKLFGIKTDSVSLRAATIKDIKQPRSWDGEDHFYLTQVIPSFLSNIEAGITGNDARIFNPNTGKFTTIKAVKQKLDRKEAEVANQNTGEFRNKMETILRSNMNINTDDTEVAKLLEDSMNQLIVGIQRTGGLRVTRDNKSALDEILTNPIYGKNENMRKLLHQAAKIVADYDPGVFGRMTGNVVIQKNDEAERRLKGNVNDLGFEELVGMTGSDINWINGRGFTAGENQGFIKNPLATADNNGFNNSLLSWQEKIYNVLVDIRDYGTMGGGSGGGSGIPVIGSLLDRLKALVKKPETVGDKAEKARIKAKIKELEKEEKEKKKQADDLAKRMARGESRGIDDMVDYHYDPMSSLHMLQRYKTLGDAELSAEFAANIDQYIQDGKLTDKYNELEAFSRHPENVDKQAYGNWDVMKSIEMMRSRAEGKGIKVSHYDTKELLDPKGAAVQALIRDMKSHKDKTAVILQEDDIYNEQGLFDSFFGTGEARAKTEEKMKAAGFKPEKSFLENLAKAETLGKKLQLLSISVESIANSPKAILTSVLHTADKMMYEFMFGKSDEEGGSPIQGLFGKMMSKMEDAGATLNVKISNIAEKLAGGAGKWWDKGLNFLEKTFKFDITKTKESLKEQGLQFFNPFARGTKEASKSLLEDISSSVTKTFTDIGDFLQHGQVRRRAEGTEFAGDDKGELAIVSKGESILYPKYNPFNKDRDSMPDYGGMGVPNVQKTGLTYLPQGSAVLPSNVNPWNPNRAKARPAQDALNENRVQEKFDQKLSHYAEGATSVVQNIADKSTGMLKYALSQLDYDDAENLLAGLMGSLGINKETAGKMLGEAAGYGAKEFSEVLGADESTKEFAAHIFKEIWKSKAARKDPKLRAMLQGFAKSVGYKGKLETDDEILYEEYNKNEGIMNGTQQFMNQMFGVDPSRAVEETKKFIIHNTPEMMKGGMAGALAGTLFPLGGPLFGAIGGIVTSILSNNKSFMDYVFGKEIVDENGKKVGRDETGLISAKFVNSLQKYVPDIKKYGITGSLIGLVTPFGPLGGLMAGVAASYIKNNEAANRFLFGGDEDSSSGLFSKDLRTKIKKAMPNIGAAALGALFLGPFGIVGNAALGAGLGFLSTTETFKKIMLGSKDRNGIRHGGLAGAIRRHITEPLKRNFKGWVKDIGKWLKQDLVRPISRAMGPIGRYLGNAVKDTVKDLWYMISEKVAGPGSRLESIFNTIFYGIKKSGGVGKWLAQNIIGGLGTLLGKGIGKIGDMARKRNYRKGNTGNETAAEVITNLEKMGSTDDRTHNMYQSIVDVKRADVDLLTTQANMARELQWAFGHQGTMAIKDHQSKVYGYLSSDINAQTMTNPKLADMHNTLIDYAKTLANAESEKDVDRLLKSVKKELHAAHIEGEDFDKIMNSFYTNAAEIRLAKVAEQMRNEGLASHKQAIGILKNTYGFSDLSDKEFIDDHLEPLMKALNNEVRLNYTTLKQSEEEQKALGHEANSSLLAGEGNVQTKATRQYQESVVKNLQVIGKILAVGKEGLDLGLIDRITKTSNASQIDMHRFNMALKNTSATVAMHQRKDKKERTEQDTELIQKAQAIGATKTIKNLDLEDLRQTIGTNNRSYTATMIKLGEAEKEGVNAVVEDLKMIMELDTKKDGKIFERIGALTISGLTVPPEQYEVINDLSDEAFACALELVRSGITIGDFGIFKKYDKNDKYEMDLLVKMAKYKYHLTDDQGNTIERNASDFLTAEAMQRNLMTTEATNAKSFSAMPAYIEYLANHGSKNLKTKEHEIGFEMNNRKSGGTILSDKRLHELDKINAKSSEVSQVTGVHNGVYGLAQKAGNLISSGVNYALDRQVDILEATGNFLTGNRKLGTKTIDAINTAKNMLTDQRYRDDKANILGNKIFFSFLQYWGDKITNILGDSAYIVFEDAMKHPDHIKAYENLFSNIYNAKNGVKKLDLVFDPDKIKGHIQSIASGKDPFGKLSLTQPDVGNEATAPDEKKTGVPGIDQHAYGTKFAGLGTKITLPHYAGGVLNTLKNFVLGGVAFGGGSKDDSEKKDDKSKEAEETSEDTDTAVKSVDKAAKEIGAALTASTAFHTVFNKENTPPKPKATTGSDGNTMVADTAYGPLTFVRSSADGDWMLDPAADTNKDVQAAIDKDTELKERIATAIEEMNASFKEGFGGAKKAGKIASGGGLFDLFKSAMSLPGEIMSGVAAALVGIPIIGGLIGKVLSPITGFFGKIKNKLGMGEKDAAKGAAKGGGAKFASKALSAIAKGVPFPIKLLVAALGTLLGLSLIPSSAEAAEIGSDGLTDLGEGSDTDINNAINQTGGPKPQSSSSILNNPIISAPLNFAAEYPLIPGVLGAGAGMALTNAIVSQTRYGKAANKVDAINKKIEALQADTKLSKEVKARRIARWEQELAKANAKAGEARIKTPLAAVEKALPNIAQLIKKNKAGATALAVLSGLGLYAGKTIYDDSEFARYGSMQKDVIDAAGDFATFHADGQRRSSHAYDPYKNGFKNGISMKYQNYADDRKLNKHWTDEQITAWLKSEQQKGYNIFETHTKNDDRVQTAKNAAHWVNDTFIPTPVSMLRSTAIDLATRGMTGYQMGSARHAGVSALLKTGADIALGNKELDAGTVLDFGKNFASTYITNNITKSLWNWSNASTTRETTFLDKLRRENFKNPQLQPQIEKIQKAYAADLANAKARGDTKTWNILNRAQQEELRAATKQFAINTGRIEPPNKAVGALKTAGKYGAKLISLPFGAATQGNKVAMTAGLAAMTALHYGQKYLATDEERERMEQEEKNEEAKRQEFEKQMKALPRLQKGEKIVETDNGWAIIRKNGHNEYITEEQKQLYDAAADYDRNKGSGNIVDRGMTAWEDLLRKVPVAGSVLPMWFGSHGLGDLAGTTLFSKNRIIGGGLGRLMMDIAQGKEIDARRVWDDFYESMMLRTAGRIWDYALGKDRQGNKVNRAQMISEDFSKIFSKEYHTENIKNLRRTAGIRWIPKIGLNDLPAASSADDMSKLMSQAEAEKMLVDLEESRNRIKEYRLKNGLSVEELQERAKSDKALKYQLDKVDFMKNRLEEAGVSSIESEEDRKYNEAMDKYKEREIEKARQARLEYESVKEKLDAKQADLKTLTHDGKRKVNTSIKKVTKRLSDVDKEIKNMEQSRENTYKDNKKVKNFKQQLSQIEETLASEQADLDSKQKALKTAKENYKKATKKGFVPEEIKKAYTDAKAEFDDAAKRVDKSVKQLTKTRLDYTDLTNKLAKEFDDVAGQELQDLKKEQQKLKTELKELKQTQKTINTEAKKLSSEIKTLREEVSKVKPTREAASGPSAKTGAVPPTQESKVQETTKATESAKPTTNIQERYVSIKEQMTGQKAVNNVNTPPTSTEPKIGEQPSSQESVKTTSKPIVEEDINKLKQQVKQLEQEQIRLQDERTKLGMSGAKGKDLEEIKEKQRLNAEKLQQTRTSLQEVETKSIAKQNSINASIQQQQFRQRYMNSINTPPVTSQEISLLEIRENNLYNLRNMLPEERVQALAQRETYIQTQLDKLNAKETLTESEAKLKNSLLTEQKDLKKLSAETTAEYKAGEAQNVKTGKSLNLMDRFKRTSVGKTLAKIRKDAVFKSVGSFAVTAVAVAGFDHALGEEEHEATDEEILQRKLPPGLSIVKDEDGNLVVVGKDGQPLKDQSAVQRKLPIISPGQEIVWDEEGHMVLVDEQTGEPVPDQTPVTANQDATDFHNNALKARTFGQLGFNVAKSVVNKLTKYDKTKAAGEFIQKQAGKVGEALHTVKSAVFGKYADQKIQLMEKPQFLQNAGRKISNTLNMAIVNAKKTEAQALIKSQAEKAAIADAATEGQKKTILAKAHDMFQSFLNIVRENKLCSTKWMAAIKSFGTALLEFMAKPEIMKKIMAKIAQKVTSIAIGAVTFGLGTALLNAAFIIHGFYTGWTEPEVLLKIPAGKATDGMKLFCAILRALENVGIFFGITIMILNEHGYTIKFLSDAGVTQAFGFDENLLQSMRKEVKIEEQQEREEETGKDTNEEKGIFDKIKDFFTFDPKGKGNQRPNASNINNQQNNANNNQDNKTEEPSLWQRVKNFFTFNPNLGKGKGKSRVKVYGKGIKYAQQTDPSVANIPIKSGGKFSPNMTGKTAGCQVTAFENARIFGKGYAEDMQLASEYAPDYEDGTTPELSTALARRHGLQSARVNAQTGTKLLDENTNMVAQVNSSMLSDKDRRIMQFPEGDYAHYITIKKNKNGYSFIDPDDPSGIGHEKALPSHAINSLSNATLIHNTGYGMGKSNKVALINESKDDLYKDAQAMSWTNIDSSLKPDFENDKVEIIRNKIREAAKINATKEYLGGPPKYGKGNTMSVEGQRGGTCTIHSTKNILRAYTGREPDFDPDNEAYFDYWWGWLHDDRLKITDHGFRQNQRADFEKTIADHFSKKPNNPIFLYQTGGDGYRANTPHPINRVSGNHATIIGRKLSNGKYEDYDSNGPTIHQLDLKEIFDETATGESQNMEEFGGNYLGIPSIDPSSPITEWNGSSGASASASQTDSPSTSSSDQQSRSSTGGLTLEQIIRKRHQLEEIMRGERQDLDPDLLGGSSDSNGMPTSSGGATGDKMTEEQIWDWFRSKGYSADATAGIMGRMKQEHDFNPTYAKFQYEPEAGGTGEVGGMGMFQWTWDTGRGYEHPDLEEGKRLFPDSRLGKYLRWCEEKGVPIESSASQLNYLWERDIADQKSHGDFTPNNMNKMTASEAATYWTDKFERGVTGYEQSYANSFLEKFKDRSVSGKGKFPSILGKGYQYLQEFWNKGKGLFGKQIGYDYTKIPNNMNIGSNVKKEQIQDVINKHRVGKLKHRLANEKEHELKAFRFFSSAFGETMAAVLMANMNSLPTSYNNGQPAWGYFGIPAYRKPEYYKYTRQTNFEETDDDFIKQMYYLAHIVKTSDQAQIEEIRKQNLNTATAIWYKIFDKSQLTNIRHAQENARKIYELYALGARVTSGDMNSPGLIDEYSKKIGNPDIMGATDDAKVEEMTGTKVQDESTSTEDTSSTSPTASSSSYLQRQGMIGALNDWISTVSLWDVPDIGSVANAASNIITGSDTKKADGNDIQSKIWNHLAPQYGPIAAAAIMGNMEAESSYNPADVNPDGGASGLCQWYADRNNKMRAYAASKGKDWTDVDSQLEYLDQEIAASYADTIKSLNNMTVEEAAIKWENAFERSEDSDSFPRRQKSAREAYDKFQGQGKGKGKYGKKNFFSNIWDGIKSGAKTIWDTIREPFVKAYNIPSKTFKTGPYNDQNTPTNLDTPQKPDNINTEQVTDIKAPNGIYVTKNDYDYLKNKNPQWDDAAIKAMLFDHPKYKDKKEEPNKSDISQDSTQIKPQQQSSQPVQSKPSKKLSSEPMNIGAIKFKFNPILHSNGLGKGKYGRQLMPVDDYHTVQQKMQRLQDGQKFNINEYIIPKTNEGERAWDFLSRAQGKNFAAIAMASMGRYTMPGNSGKPTYAGSFKFSPERQAQYKEYLKTHTLEESDDDFTGQMKYINNVANNSDPFTMDLIKNKAKLDYGTELWYKAFDPSVNMKETQKRAKQIYVTYTGLGQSQSLAGMERETNMHVPDVLGTTTEEDKAKFLQQDYLKIDENNDSLTVQQAKTDAMGGALDAVMATLNATKDNSWISKAQVAISQLGGAVKNAISSLPPAVTAGFKWLFGEKWVDKLAGSFARSSSSSTSNSNFSTSSNSIKTTGDGKGLADVIDEGWSNKLAGNPGSLGSVQRITVHNSGENSKTDTMQSLDKLGREKGDKLGIAYHYIIFADGTIKKGRSDDQLGSHTWRLNSNNIGVACSGNYDKETPSKELIDSLIHLLADLCIKYNLSIDRQTIRGHRERFIDDWNAGGPTTQPPNGFTSLEEASSYTTCPGNALASKLDEIVEKAKELAQHNIQSNNTTSTNVIATAEDFVKRNVPYVFGGERPTGIDCSGLVQYCYSKANITIRRDADMQYDDFKSVGAIKTDLKDIKPGDEVFFRGSNPGSNGVGHCGIFYKDGEYIEAQKKGTHVMVSKISSRQDFVGYGDLQKYAANMGKLNRQDNLDFCTYDQLKIISDKLDWSTNDIEQKPKWGTEEDWKCRQKVYIKTGFIDKTTMNFPNGQGKYGKSNYKFNLQDYEHKKFGIPASSISTSYSTQDTKSILPDKSNEYKFGKGRYGKQIGYDYTKIPNYDMNTGYNARQKEIRDVINKHKDAKRKRWNHHNPQPTTSNFKSRIIPTSYYDYTNKAPTKQAEYHYYAPPNPKIVKEHQEAKPQYHPTSSQPTTSNFMSRIRNTSPLNSYTENIQNHLPTPSSIPNYNSYKTEDLSSYQAQWQQNLKKREAELAEMNARFNRRTPNLSTSWAKVGERMTEEQIWDWFRAKGYTAEATAGIMGRLVQETSNYNPAWEPISKLSDGTELGGMGMFQWTWDRGEYADEPPEPNLSEGRRKWPESRLASYLKWADTKHLPYESNKSQLKYLWEEDLNSESHVLWTGHTFRPAEMNNYDIAGAAALWTSQYERGVPEPENELAYGTEIYNKYKDKPVNTTLGMGKYGKAAPLIIAGLDSLISAARSIILPKLIQRYGQTQALQIFNKIQLLVPKLSEVLKAIGIALNVQVLVEIIDTASQLLDEHKWLSYSTDDLLGLMLDIAKNAGMNFARKRIFGFGKGIKEDLINLQHMEPIKVPQEISSKATEKFWDDSDKQYGKGIHSEEITKTDEPNVVRTIDKLSSNKEIWDKIPDYNKPNYKTESINVLKAKFMAIDSQLGTSYYQEAFGEPFDIDYIDEDIIDDNPFTLPPSPLEQTPSYDIPYLGAGVIKSKCQEINKCGPQDVGCGFGKGILHDTDFDEMKNTYSAFNESNKNNTDNYIQNWNAEPVNVIRSKLEAQMRNTAIDKPYQDPKPINKVEDVIQQMHDDGTWSQIPEYNRPTSDDSINVIIAKLDTINKQFGTNYELGKQGKGKVEDQYTFNMPTKEQLLERIKPEYSQLQEIEKSKEQILNTSAEPKTDIKAPNGTYVIKNDYDYLKNQGYDDIAIRKILFENDKYKKSEEPTTDTIKRIREQPTTVGDVTQAKVDTFKGGEYFNDSSKVSPKVRLYLKNNATLDDVAKDIGFNTIPNDDTILTAEQQQALGYRNYNKIRTWAHFNTDTQLWDGTPDVDRALGIKYNEQYQFNDIPTTPKEIIQQRTFDPKKNYKTLPTKYQAQHNTTDYWEAPTTYTFKIPKLGKGKYDFKASDYTSFTKYRPSSSKSFFDLDNVTESKLFNNKKDYYSALRKRKFFDSKSLNFYPSLSKPKTRTVYDLSSEELRNKVKDLQASPEWDTIPDYNKPDIENDNQMVIREKLRRIEEAKNMNIDTPSLEAKKTADQIQNAKDKTEKIINDIKTSLGSTISTETNKLQTKEIPKKNQPTIISENLNKEQLEQLIKEQQQTNNLLLKLIEAIMTSGKSIENSIMNNTPSQSDTNTRTSSMQRGSMISGMEGSIPVNNNINNVLRALNMFGSGNN